MASTLIGFVDAGFLRAEGARTLGVPASRVKIRAEGVVETFRHFAAVEDCTLLRVYWYDSAFETNAPQYATQRPFFDAISSIPGIQLRLGHIKSSMPGWHQAVRSAIQACGWDVERFSEQFSFRPMLEQKGVDTLIVLDLVRLAQRGAYDTAVLLAGDRDLAEAVRVSQDEGRRLVLTYPGAGGVARELRQLADDLHPLSPPELEEMLTVQPDPGPGGWRNATREISPI